MLLELVMNRYCPTFSLRTTFLLVPLCALLLVGTHVPGTTESSSTDDAGFIARTTQRAVDRIQKSVVNVRPEVKWDKIPPLQKLIEQQDNDLLTRFYDDVKSKRIFTTGHKKALRTLLYRLDARQFEAFMRKFRQVLQNPTGARDVLDFLQYIAPPESGFSGVLLNGGYVLTTNFAISNPHMSSLHVHTAGGGTLQGSVEGTYDGFDLALVKISKGNVPDEAEPISISRRNAEQKTDVGHWAIAVGRGPRPENVTASRGIVSANQLFAGRFLQTDAFCNYSNTGGALVNIHGELIGVIRGVTLKNALFAGLNSGVNRAVKPEAIREVLPDLKKGKDIRSSFLGVQKSNNSSPKHGVRVSRVIDGCAAAKAGLKDNDVILSFAKKEIYKWRDLVNKIRRHIPGDKVTVKVKRDGNVKTFEIELTTRACLEEN